MDVTKTPLYRALKPAIRKQDHGTLRRELQRVMECSHAAAFDENETSLPRAFLWFATQQGHEYWQALAARLIKAGWSCA